eukprot:TRINITY_DN12194_c0_g2_i4.p2 TRINITY_DN12194_c0_g2~~TRINITY_DN12194_c0_g2_i4.p2  ORF type:complete len:123 (-),score=2.59 TRINITY_DN12194_c0_g2_i4:342-710(-)
MPPASQANVMIAQSLPLFCIFERSILSSNMYLEQNRYKLFENSTLSYCILWLHVVIIHMFIDGVCILWCFMGNQLSLIELGCCAVKYHPVDMIINLRMQFWINSQLYHRISLVVLQVLGLYD